MTEERALSNRLFDALLDHCCEDPAIKSLSKAGFEWQGFACAFEGTKDGAIMRLQNHDEVITLNYHYGRSLIVWNEPSPVLLTKLILMLP